jgi:putative membrane protein
MRKGRIHTAPGAIGALLIALTVSTAPGPSAAQAQPAGLRADAAMSDAQIAGLVLSAASTNVTEGELALRKASDARTLSLARRVVSDNTDLARAALEAVEKARLKPAESDESTRLTAETMGSVDRLAELKGRQFDRAYVSGEIADNRDLIARLDGRLLSETRDPALRELLTRTRQVAQEHLQQAQAVATDLAG